MTTIDDLWSMVCLGGVLVGLAGVVVAAIFAAVQMLRQPVPDGDDGEPRDVPEDRAYELRLDSALGAPVPPPVAAMMIAEIEREWMARQRGTGGVR